MIKIELAEQQILVIFCSKLPLEREVVGSLARAKVRSGDLRTCADVIFGFSMNAGSKGRCVTVIHSF
jgi:hypothetical protein